MSGFLRWNGPPTGGDTRKLSDLASGQLPIGKTAPERVGKRQPIEFFHELSSRNGSFDRFRVSSEGAVLLLAAWRAEARQAAMVKNSPLPGRSSNSRPSIQARATTP